MPYKDPEKQRAYDAARKKMLYHSNPEYRERERARIAQIKTVSYRAAVAASTRKRYHLDPEYREQHLLRCSQENSKLRLLAFEHLGGAVCTACGYCKDYRALQIDHINGGGSVDRTGGHGPTWYRKILLDPDAKLRLQVLCANCNQLKRFDNNEHRKAHHVTRGVIQNLQA